MDSVESGRYRVDSVQEQKLMKAVKHLFWEMEKSSSEAGYLVTFKVRAPRDSGDDYLVIATRVADDGTPEVGFHAATTLPDVLTGLGNRLRNGSFKWKADQYNNGG
jgi:hypothetical protein